jgi:hypothetical protein
MIILKIHTLFILIILISFSKAQSFGFIDVSNAGSFIARFMVSYTLDGKQITRSSGDFLVNQSRVLLTPWGARDLKLRIQMMTFFGIYQDILSIDLVSSEKCYIISGNVFEARWNQLAC